jgi:chromosome segregation ATPase
MRRGRPLTDDVQRLNGRAERLAAEAEQHALVLRAITGERDDARRRAEAVELELAAAREASSDALAELMAVRVDADRVLTELATSRETEARLRAELGSARARLAVQRPPEPRPRGTIGALRQLVGR